METKNTKKYKHLTLEERIEIQSMLTQGATLSMIAQTLKKNICTISKEVKRNLRRRGIKANILNFLKKLFG